MCTFEMSKATKPRRNPPLIMLHFVLFDGSSSFVGSSDDITSEMEVVFKSNDLDECCDFCDDYNDSI
tara:strand:+ start:95 stop:295 length:201 start_codon:yes stop_codon:yes gene_type:complete